MLLTKKKINGAFFIFIILTGIPYVSFSLTIEEAICLATKNLPSYKAAGIKVRSSEFLYKASLSPYLPSLDISGYQEYINTSADSYDVAGYEATFSYTLFDGGQRKANRNIARLNLDSGIQELKENLLNLEYDVKVAFYTAIAGKNIFDQRELQIKDAQKVYEVAQGKHRAGVSLRSDVLQASVRLNQARFDMRQAEGELAKSMLELNSLLGREPDSLYNLESTMNVDIIRPDKKELTRIALDRPLARQMQNDLEISENNQSLSESKFYPTFSFDLSYQNRESYKENFDISTENKSAAIIGKWNIFELDKFYQKKSSRLETRASRENLNDIKRQLILGVQRACEDYLTSVESLTLAMEQLVESQFNYDQALGEYKAGKGDILSLVQAESLLSDARNQASDSRLSFAISRAELEQAAGIKSLASMKKTGAE